LASKNTSPLTDPFYIFGQLFSVLASENAGLLASLASALKNLSTPLIVSRTEAAFTMVAVKKQH
jgi:hypothetical protein